MRQAAAKSQACRPSRGPAGVDTHHLGQALRSVYESGIDKQPIPDSQIDLLLRLRSKERDLRRGA